MALPPTTANVFQHIFGAYLQVNVLKAANCLAHTDDSTAIIRLVGVQDGRTSCLDWRWGGYLRRGT